MMPTVFKIVHIKLFLLGGDLYFLILSLNGFQKQ